MFHFIIVSFDDYQQSLSVVLCGWKHKVLSTNSTTSCLCIFGEKMTLGHQFLATGQFDLRPSNPLQLRRSWRVFEERH